MASLAGSRQCTRRLLRLAIYSCRQLWPSSLCRTVRFPERHLQGRKVDMGAGRFTPADWDKFTRTRTAGRSASSIFSHTQKETLDPKQIKNGLRESRDSAINPASNAIIVGL